MQNLLSRCLLFGILLTWALSHATVLGQQNGKAAAADKLLRGLDKTLTLDFTGQSLSDALNHLRDKTGLMINVDQFVLMQMGINPDDNMGQVQIKANNEKASQIFRKLLNAYRLTYIVLEDAIVITTDDMAIARQLRQRISVDMEDIPFKKAVRELARRHGINLVIDAKLQQHVETPVSLQIDNTSIETTIRLLAELVSLKAVRVGDVMFVTSEAKAKKIREEEVHQINNPMNPNGFPAVGNAFAPIGGFGGVAVPGRAVPPLPGIGVPGNPPPVQNQLPPRVDPPVVPDAKKLLPPG